MKLCLPDYLSAFHCKASACRHTCCAGWEIDVDPDTVRRYREMDGSLGDSLRAALETDAEGNAHFRLTEEERCPMLRPDGLCRVICERGEEALCQICTDHPRWRCFFSDRV